MTSIASVMTSMPWHNLRLAEPVLALESEVLVETEKAKSMEHAAPHSSVLSLGICAPAGMDEQFDVRQGEKLRVPVHLHPHSGADSPSFRATPSRERDVADTCTDTAVLVSGRGPAPAPRTGQVPMSFAPTDRWTTTNMREQMRVRIMIGSVFCLVF